MAAMVARLSPREDRKLAKMLMSSRLKFLLKIQESGLAKVTSSQPEGQLQEFINITCFILCGK